MPRLETFCTIACVVLAFSIFGCGPISQSDFDVKKFETFEGSSLLCFDLQAEYGPPKAGLLLREARNLPGGRHDLVLPFATKVVTSNRRVLMTSASYENFTVLTFSFGQPSQSAANVALVPELKPFSERPQVDALAPGIYFQENGLERWFAYVDGTNDIVSLLQAEFPAMTFKGANAVAITLPEKSEGRDIKRGRSIDPSPSKYAGNAMLFGTDTPPKYVILRYALQPTLAQKAAASIGLKLLLILIVPVLTLIYLNPEDVQRPHLRKIAIWAGIILQLICVAFVCWGAMVTGKPSMEVVLEFVLAGLGVTIQAVIILVKSKRRTLQEREK